MIHLLSCTVHTPFFPFPQEYSKKEGLHYITTARFCYDTSHACMHYIKYKKDTIHNGETNRAFFFTFFFFFFFLCTAFFSTIDYRIQASTDKKNKEKKAI